jgi:VanZ family protein
VQKFNRLAKYWFLPLFWMLVIFSASGDANSYHRSSTLFEPLLRWLFPHLPSTRIETLHLLFRKGCHLAEYAIFALLLWRAIRNSMEEIQCQESSGGAVLPPEKKPAGMAAEPAGRDARATTVPSSARPWHWNEAGLALALVFLYAASDELHQVFVPGRTGQISDVVVDVAGAVAGLTLLWLGGKIFKHW